MMDLGLKGKVALITGGSSGIGKSIALALAREGVSIAICTPFKKELEEAAREISSSTGRQVLPVEADMTVLEDVQRFVNTSATHFGRIDILAYSANIPGGGTFAQISDEDWCHHLNLKLLGCIRCAREVIPHMQKTHWGRIIIISGMSARIIRPTAVDNGPICGALSNFGKQLANEVAPDGILVNTIHPDATNTPRLQHRVARIVSTQGITAEEVMEQMAKRVPIGRLIEPEDIANLALFLCSQHASAITGQSIAVDGGGGTSINY